MLLVESFAGDKGIWFMDGTSFFQLGNHETVSSLLSAGVKTAKWSTDDFQRLTNAKNADDQALALINESLDEIEAAVETNP